MKKMALNRHGLLRFTLYKEVVEQKSEGNLNKSTRFNRMSQSYRSPETV
ncbi:hypothetical protein LZ575_07325 [Antarcticibacterium sp. 1MA-6-2]|nr:hypothetical protein [Antarcticibacterium sp. 1MA-6-2]UJH92332.1 hypothetical protein LZ575_07325 [Antarcticibacterium sp. 1MA-6-2]